MKTKLLLMALFAFLSVKMHAQCSAAFTSTSAPNGAYTFNATGSNAPSTIYYWNFGNGSVGNGQTVTTAYNSPGTYTVCLVVVDTFSTCTDSSCTTITVTSGAPCAASYSYICNVNSTVSLSSNGSSSANMSYTWLVNNAVVGTGANYTYSNVPGTYTICLAIADATTSCVDTFCDVITLSNSTPSCAASYYIYPDTNGAPHTYIGVNTSTGTNLTYVWTWGDGSSSTGAYPSHTYATAGNYQICLYISSPNSNCSDSMCLAQTINKTTAMYSVNFQNPTAVNNVQQEIASLYPNPAQSSFTLKGKNGATYNVEFYTINGAKVKTVQAKSNETINISALASSIYILKVTDQNGASQFSKLIKE
jgi:PKD repeat protein